MYPWRIIAKNALKKFPKNIWNSDFLNEILENLFEESMIKLSKEPLHWWNVWKKLSKNYSSFLKFSKKMHLEVSDGNPRGISQRIPWLIGIWKNLWRKSGESLKKKKRKENTWNIFHYSSWMSLLRNPQTNFWRNLCKISWQPLWRNFWRKSSKIF